MIRSWKTTLAGVLTIVGAVSAYALDFLQNDVIGDVTPLLTVIGAGIGLIVAGDAPKAPPK